jgi:hypothetical protein
MKLHTSFKVLINVTSGRKDDIIRSVINFKNPLKNCGSATPCASPPPCPFFFSYFSFWVHHPANRDDQHLLALDVNGL